MSGVLASSALRRSLIFSIVLVSKVVLGVSVLADFELSTV